MRIDPSLVKRLSKRHPKRILYTVWARLSNYSSRFFFDEYKLPIRTLTELPPAPSVRWEETQVVQLQAQYLLWALRETESVEGCVVEVGAWRGVTTSVLASHTSAVVVAIDPWIGPLNEVNLNAFLDATSSFSNVVYERKTFGQAVREWNHGPARLIFIDAAHDYANVAHDLAAARRLICDGGMIALHDTDNAAFPGCRRAVYEVAEQYELAAHIGDLTIFKV